MPTTMTTADAGRIGGLARSANLSKERIREISIKASMAAKAARRKKKLLQKDAS